MKKTLTILTIIAIALVAMMSSVNAATVSASPAETTKLSVGDTVTVTIGTEGAEGLQFDLAYPAGFEYVKATASATCDVRQDAGSLGIATFANSVTVTFKATEEMVAGEENLVKEFVVSNYKASGTDDRAGATATVTIKAEEPAPSEEPSPSPSGNPGEGSGEGSGENPTGDKTSPSPSSKTDEDGVEGTNGEELNELPKTGAPIYIGAIAVIVLAGAVLVVRKIRK